MMVRLFNDGATPTSGSRTHSHNVCLLRFPDTNSNKAKTDIAQRLSQVPLIFESYNRTTTSLDVRNDKLKLNTAVLNYLKKPPYRFIINQNSIKIYWPESPATTPGSLAASSQSAVQTQSPQQQKRTPINTVTSPHHPATPANLQITLPRFNGAAAQRRTSNDQNASGKSLATRSVTRTTQSQQQKTNNDNNKNKRI
ncbi:unnamed protein product [Didymodactylos carnosus]|uniref:Uncharacterized protein n=1 Tax=Didymodactylos carnosus TaxID=1234261 RepID=A0A814TMV2_9BILA|nr:unnamed protein product [Didymodactylos carnosus]CAF1163590.1 unnamed protein product [Didymodactylos carnosus]CAF3888695.1 unnamed protein product [Didymodactylos carnosus]CAF3927221.1 unnamed protein product [Didymodactylos carnosus]